MPANALRKEHQKVAVLKVETKVAAKEAAVLVSSVERKAISPEIVHRAVPKAREKVKAEVVSAMTTAIRAAVGSAMSAVSATRLLETRAISMFSQACALFRIVVLQRLARTCHVWQGCKVL